MATEGVHDVARVPSVILEPCMFVATRVCVSERSGCKRSRIVTEDTHAAAVGRREDKWLRGA
jgi:hypothetical protein